MTSAGAADAHAVPGAGACGALWRGGLWLPGLVPQSVLRDVFQVRLSSLARAAVATTRGRVRAGAEAVASEWHRLIHEGTVENRAALARRQGVSRARVTQVLGTANSA